MAEDVFVSTSTGVVGIRRTVKDAASGGGKTVLVPITAAEIDSSGQFSGGGGSGGGSSGASADGDMQAVPAGSANGTVLPNRPSGASGVILDLGPADALTYTIATSAPGAPPASTVTVDGATYGRWTEQLGPSTNVYVTSRTGAPKFRWV